MPDALGIHYFSSTGATRRHSSAHRIGRGEIPLLCAHWWTWGHVTCLMVQSVSTSTSFTSGPFSHRFRRKHQLAQPRRTLHSRGTAIIEWHVHTCRRRSPIDTVVFQAHGNRAYRTILRQSLACVPVSLPRRRCDHECQWLRAVTKSSSGLTSVADCAASPLPP